MTHTRTIVLISLAALVSSLLLAANGCLGAKSSSTSDAAHQLASKLIPAQTRTRNSRSLSDMFEKVKSKIFGTRKAAAAAAASQQAIQPAASVNAAQRQPWTDINSFNAQYSPYSGFAAWPNSNPSQYLNQPYGSGASFGAGPQANSPFSGLTGLQSVDSMQSVAGGQPGQQQQQQQAQQPGSSSSLTGSNSGLFSSASHLIAQYLAPSGSGIAGQMGPGGVQSSQQSSQQSPAQQAQQQAIPQQGQQGSSLMNSQQQNQYNEFASMLDSMVAQTGVMPASGRQAFLPGSNSNYQPAQNGQPPMVSDNEMSGSSNIQSYLQPGAVGSQKPMGASAGPSSGTGSGSSSMVSLAEQLAPGAQFNKLVSFPFSLTNNDDSTKEGKYKLHIPFLNQHVKRSDQQQQVVPVNQQQQQQRLNQQQQYLSTYYTNQQQQYANLAAQAAAAMAAATNQASQQAVASAAGQQSSAAAASGVNSVSGQQSSALLSATNSLSPSAGSSALSQQAANGLRSTWSVADQVSSAVAAPATSGQAAKLVPYQSSASSQAGGSPSGASALETSLAAQVSSQQN